MPKDETLSELFASLHWVLTKVMAAAVFLHIAGALKHQIVDKDATLRRMWFGKSDAPATGPHMSSLTPPVVALVLTAVASMGAAYMASSQSHEGPAVAALESVESEWQVTDGALAIVIKVCSSGGTKPRPSRLSVSRNEQCI